MNKLAPTARQYCNKLATKTQKTRFFAALFGCLPWVVFGTTKPRINLFYPVADRTPQRYGNFHILQKSSEHRNRNAPNLSYYLRPVAFCGRGRHKLPPEHFCAIADRSKTFFHNAAKYAYHVITLSNPLKIYLEMPEI